MMMKLLCPSQYLEDSDADPAMIFEKDNFSENNSSQLYEAINQLDDRSRDILQDRWLADENSLHELAEKYHISAERVRQIEKNAMKKIKQSFSSGNNLQLQERLKSFVLRKGRLTANQKEALSNLKDKYLIDDNFELDTLRTNKVIALDIGFGSGETQSILLDHLQKLLF